MNIVLPNVSVGGEGNEDRVREREVRQRARLRRSRSRSRPISPSQSRSNSVCRKASTTIFPLPFESFQATKEAVKDKKGSGKPISRSGPLGSMTSSVGKRIYDAKISYDADASEEEDEPARGRSRRGKVLAKDVKPEYGRRLSEGGMRVLGQRSGSNSRGRL